MLIDIIDDDCSVCIILFRIFRSFLIIFFFFKQKTAYEMRISDWSSDVCSSDLISTKPASAPTKACTIHANRNSTTPSSAIPHSQMPIAQRRISEGGRGDRKSVV